MSEFFKALDQAERDRRRLEGLTEPDQRADGAKDESPGLVSERPAIPTPPSQDPTRPRRATGPTARRKPRPGVPGLVAHVDPNSVAAEAYRTMRTNLEFARTEHACRNIAVTSPVAGSGKSTTAANLAVVAAQSGWRVCLVDADFWRPVLHEVFGLSNTDGLTTALEGRLPLHSTARDTEIENLSVVVSGQNGAGPAQHIFTSQRLQKVLLDGSNHFDLVIYDTPPVISVADAVNVAALCDGVVLVVRYGSIPPSVLRRAVRQVTQVNGRILGVLLNQVDLRGGEDDVYGYYRSYHDVHKRKR